MLLPCEIWLHIISYIDTIKDIYALTSTCCLLYTLRYDKYTEKIYRNIRITDVLKEKIKRTDALKKQPWKQYVPMPQPYETSLNKIEPLIEKCQCLSISLNIFENLLILPIIDSSVIWHVTGWELCRDIFIKKMGDLMIGIKVPNTCKDKKLIMCFHNIYISKNIYVDMPIINNEVRFDDNPIPLSNIPFETLGLSIENCMVEYIILDDRRINLQQSARVNGVFDNYYWREKSDEKYISGKQLYISGGGVCNYITH